MIINQNGQLSVEQVFYLKKVLGIDQILIPDQDDQAEIEEARDSIESFQSKESIDLSIGEHSKISESIRLIIFLPLTSHEFPLRGEAYALIEKMIRAMKLEIGEVLLMSWNEHVPQSDQCIATVPDQANGRPVLIFGKSAAERILGPDATLGQWMKWRGVQVMATHSPRELLAQPEYKKSTWVHLQTIMKVL